MGPIGEGRWWVVLRGGLDFLGPLLQNFSGALSRNFKCIIGFLSSRTVDWHPFLKSGVKGGVDYGWVVQLDSTLCSQAPPEAASPAAAIHCWPQGAAAHEESGSESVCAPLVRDKELRSLRKQACERANALLIT
eukprot:1143467-Pelagomonas_calceolata.AAC.1